MAVRHFRPVDHQEHSITKRRRRRLHIISEAKIYARRFTNGTAGQAHAPVSATSAEVICAQKTFRRRKRPLMCQVRLEENNIRS
ncbi:hypothetical protein L596_005321 [Steinernema carpocapsae]|uniref:Uncharacterized protein n=1 Tax=Steinernema carpocapsae TaxID=34508 RepID=A0A4V6I8E9_STECR|nr:hypothetical protein L596_005321 [Steinernema carpocapsae]